MKILLAKYIVLSLGKETHESVRCIQEAKSMCRQQNPTHKLFIREHKQKPERLSGRHKLSDSNSIIDADEAVESCTI